MAKRTCLGPVDRYERCARYALPGKDRCAVHFVPRKPTPSGRITQTTRWRRLRREFIAAQPRPLTCSICKREIVEERHGPPEVDHITEIAAGGDPWDLGNLQLAHMRCNRRKKARSPSPAQRRAAEDRERRMQRLLGR